MELYKDSFYVDSLELDERTEQLLNIFVENLKQYKIRFPEIIFELSFKDSIYEAFLPKKNADIINNLVATRFCLYYRHFKELEQFPSTDLKDILVKQCNDSMFEYRQELIKRRKEPYTKDEFNRKKQEIVIFSSFLRTPIVDVFNKSDASFMYEFYTKECQSISILMDKY